MLTFKLALLNALFILAFILILPGAPGLFALICLLLVGLALVLLRQSQQRHAQVLQSLADGLRNLQDGDFAISLAEKPFEKQQQHLGVIRLFNQVSDKLRAEKQALYQRELLLDKVVNASDVVTVLVNHRNKIIFANHAARLFLETCGVNRTSLLGQEWTVLMKEHKPELLAYVGESTVGNPDGQDIGVQGEVLADKAYQAQAGQSSAIIQLKEDENAPESSGMEQSWHLSRHQLKLHGSRHQLFLLKPMTRVLNRQEVKTWKKVIRVINHELNNSIAPISSMCHSGKVLAERIHEPRLNQVFTTISGRINKLSEFIQNYSQLARLSSPQKQEFDLVAMLEQLQSLYPFTLKCRHKQLFINGDISQLEQLVINLLKNAREAAGEIPSQVELSLQGQGICLVIRDFGPGMKPQVMQQAFLPYYSTKADGSGIGLSICREITEAHQGQISLSSPPGGGLAVSVALPQGI
ncbi:HAMP domain-containing histidine kinase [Thalassomonas viridans]|uniref:histidine kinase n=1 Tax=Thalassomonas viridans TaxID=137584 RepID=A0AAF0C848_9GAMM|nr:HAMP domain-containing sensor histidine kinase [Thalassomonas viridans]WDE04021.1 HAMP domain-containing histidine kinase [Thalassomonas viridans]